MIVTVEIKNQKTFDLLRAIEGLEFINVNSPGPPQTAEITIHEKTPPYKWLRGCCKGIPGSSVEDFITCSRTDKEHELEIEKHQEEERARRADTPNVILSRIFRENIYGMAYPYGTFTDEIKKIVEHCGLLYARGVVSTFSFDIPGDLLELQPTAKHTDTGLMELAESFIKLKPESPQVFYLWGHSYEFDIDNNWQIINDFCKLMSNKDDIYYATNAQALLGI
jgi:hypothetical protein